MAPLSPSATSYPKHQSQIRFFQSYVGRVSPAATATPTKRSSVGARFPFEHYCNPYSQSPLRRVRAVSSAPHTDSSCSTPTRINTDSPESDIVDAAGEIGDTSTHQTTEASHRQTQTNRQSYWQRTNGDRDWSEAREPTQHGLSNGTQARKMDTQPSQVESEVSVLSPQDRYVTASPGEPPLKRLRSGSSDESAVFHDAHERSSSILSPPPTSSLDPPTQNSSNTQASTIQSFPASQKRTVKNSQSGDEDDEEEDMDDPREPNADDSDSSLLSLDEIFAKLRKSSVPEDDQRRKTRSRAKAVENKAATMDRFLQKDPPPKLDHLKSFEALRAGQLREQELEAEINLAQSQAWASSEVNGSEDFDENDGDASKSLLETIVKTEGDGSADNVGKVFQAMDRVDAFGVTMGWRATAGPTVMAKDTVPSFPDSCRGVSPFDDGDVGDATSWRDQIILCQRAEVERLPEEAQFDFLNWLWESARRHSDTILSHSILKTLQSYGQRIQMAIGVTSMRRLFLDLGLCNDAIRLSDRIAPRNLRRDVNSNYALNARSSNLVRAFTLIESISISLSASCREYTLGVLLRLGIDKEITRQLGTLRALQQAVVALVNTTPSNIVNKMLFELSVGLYENITHPMLQEQLLAAVSSAKSPCLNRFRRQLALAFILNDPEALQYDFDSHDKQADHNPKRHQQLATSIVNRLQTHKAFDVFSNNVDFAELSAAVSVLDIAIGNGFWNSTNYATDRGREDALKLAETGFNESVDDLVDSLDRIAARIMDTGASHMSKSDAKVALLRLSFRLQHTVRTKPRPRRNVLAPDNFSARKSEKCIGLFDLSAQKQPQREFMKDFLSKNERDPPRKVSFKLSDDEKT